MIEYVNEFRKPKFASGSLLEFEYSGPGRWLKFHVYYVKLFYTISSFESRSADCSSAQSISKWVCQHLKFYGAVIIVQSACVAPYHSTPLKWHKHICSSFCPCITIPAIFLGWNIAIAVLPCSFTYTHTPNLNCQGPLEIRKAYLISESLYKHQLARPSTLLPYVCTIRNGLYRLRLIAWPFQLAALFIGRF